MSAGKIFLGLAPRTHNALQALVMSMAAVTKNAGKKTLLGADKGARSYEAFKAELGRTYTAMVMEGLVFEHSTNDDVLQSLDRYLEYFAEVYPNWVDAYMFAIDFLADDNRPNAEAVIARLR